MTRNKLFLGLIAFLSVLTLLYIFRTSILTWYGKQFVREDTPVPQKSVLVLLGGNLINRADYVCEMYHQINAKEIVIFKQPSVHHPFFQKYILNETELTEKFLAEHCKIQTYKVIGFNNNMPVTSTYLEANALNNYLKDNNIKNIVLITDSFHSNRAYQTFKNALPVTVNLYVKSVALPGERYNDWWTSETGIKFYFLELLKTINYYLQERAR